MANPTHTKRMIQFSRHRLIGPAATAITVLRIKAARLSERNEAVKVLLHGPRGTGKTQTALRFALELAGEEINIEHVNGKEITLEFVRDFKRRVHQRPIFGSCFVLVADECDKMTGDAKDLLISVLDQLPGHCAFIGTSNQPIAADCRMENQRFLSRLACLEVEPPLPAEIAALVLELNPGAPASIIETIATNCEGCVRSALIDAENFLDTRQAVATMAA